ncbi:MAG: hypothetical protein R3E01_12690 [Pirellulaceae bacterium]|nr:hypothetical protein [Planctomycetales bacterium]
MSKLHTIITTFVLSSAAFWALAGTAAAQGLPLTDQLGGSGGGGSYRPTTPTYVVPPPVPRTTSIPTQPTYQSRPTVNWQPMVGQFRRNVLRQSGAQIYGTYFSRQGGAMVRNDLWRSGYSGTRVVPRTIPYRNAFGQYAPRVVYDVYYQP